MLWKIEPGIGRDKQTRDRRSPGTGGPKKVGPAATRSARGLLSGYTLACRERFTGFALSDASWLTANDPTMVSNCLGEQQVGVCVRLFARESQAPAPAVVPSC
ncbi:hypothetical protein Amn_27010 [Aminobacter sp. Y103A]|nr:hypothetical protein Amn_27010 [Aminobacter sp. SS-2016]